MAIRIYTGQTAGIESTLTAVEIEITSGFDGLSLIGNVSEVCRNGVERAKAVLGQSGIRLPPRRILMSIAPADIRKDGSQFDLAFAIGLALMARGEESSLDTSQWMFVGELSLSGEVRPVRSAVSYALSAMTAGLRGIVVAGQNYQELVALRQFEIPGSDGFQVISAGTFADVLQWAFGGAASVSCNDRCSSGQDLDLYFRPNFDDMVLAPELLKAAIVTGIGRHNVLLSGTPGTGKSMFAARLPSILPRMAADEHVDALKISSYCHESVSEGILAGRPPFRAPHHQASSAAILGTPSRPGELSLAHGGVLFLDEFPEFRRDIIEALREPLETGEVQVSRARDKVCWRARITLVAATNNCPCGWFGSLRRQCMCSTNQVIAYRRRISGPILDRIDIHINTPEYAGHKSDLFGVGRLPREGLTAEMAERVRTAQDFSFARNKSVGVTYNSDLKPKDIVAISGLSEKAFAQLLDLVPGDLVSSRAMVRCLRVARSVADLDLRDSIEEEDLKTALGWQADAAARKRGDDCYGR